MTSAAAAGRGTAVSASARVPATKPTNLICPPDSRPSYWRHTTVRRPSRLPFPFTPVEPASGDMLGPDPDPDQAGGEAPKPGQAPDHAQQERRPQRLPASEHISRH